MPRPPKAGAVARNAPVVPASPRPPALTGPHMPAAPDAQNDAPAPATPPRLALRLLPWLVLLAALLAGLWYFLLRNSAPNQAPGPNPWAQPVPVLVEPARRHEFTVQVQAIGTVTPQNTVTVRSRVSGQLMRVLVREGQAVTQGQLLAEIDPEPYRVRLSQAQGQQQQNLAQLQNARSELARYRQLFQQDSIARLQLERQEALVQQLEGTLLADKAQVDDARLQLSYTRIVAPIAGRVGMRRVDAGNLVGENDANGLFTIVQTRPISVVFSVPENRVAAVRAAHESGKPPRVEIRDREDRTRLAAGVLDTLDNQIDGATSTLRLRARVDNADEALFPNQFVNVRLALQTLPDALTIPADAVQYGSRGSYVYVIVDGKARVRPLKLGPTSEGRTVVLEGLEPGEPVVLEGLDRLREGRAVIIANDAPAGRAAAGDAPSAPAGAAGGA